MDKEPLGRAAGLPPQALLVVRGSAIFVHDLGLAQQIVDQVIESIVHLPSGLALSLAAPAGQGWRASVASKKAARKLRENHEQEEEMAEKTVKVEVPPEKTVKVEVPPIDAIKLAELVTDRLVMVAPTLVAQYLHGHDVGRDVH